jgi:hypothetical protein
MSKTAKASPRSPAAPLEKFEGYSPGRHFDEMFESTGSPRPAAWPVAREIDALPVPEVLARQQAAERFLRESGVTFHVYEDIEGPERIFPFDLVPRVVEAGEWGRIEVGLRKQRPLVEGQSILADLFDSSCDTPAVHRAHRVEGPEDHEHQRAVEYIGFAVLHDSSFASRQESSLYTFW